MKSVTGYNEQFGVFVHYSNDFHSGSLNRMAKRVKSESLETQKNHRLYRNTTNPWRQ
jgi:hypothetical protein